MPCFPVIALVRVDSYWPVIDADKLHFHSEFVHGALRTGGRAAGTT
jgi:hypothetical protein